MPSSRLIRAQIEAALAKRIPSALTPQPRVVRPHAATTIAELDTLLKGGLPVGAISEIVGSESSGRTSLALAFVAGMTRAGRVCAWVDVSNALHPESAAAIGVDLSRLLWIRCGLRPDDPYRPSGKPQFAFPEKYTTPPPAIQGLHGGGHGPHPRKEANGLSTSVGELFGSHSPRCAEPVRKQRSECKVCEPETELSKGSRKKSRQPSRVQPWRRLEQALRATDLLLQAGGWASIVLDMGSIAPEHALRVPLATWFRFRAAAERSQLNFLLLTQHPCAKNSATLVLQLDPGNPLQEETTVFSGMGYRATLAHRRFSEQGRQPEFDPANSVIPLRKPPQSAGSSWCSRTFWTGRA
jgi:recombination protein RecA